MIIGPRTGVASSQCHCIGGRIRRRGISSTRESGILPERPDHILFSVSPCRATKPGSTGSDWQEGDRHGSLERTDCDRRCNHHHTDPHRGFGLECRPGESARCDQACQTRSGAIPPDALKEAWVRRTADTSAVDGRRARSSERAPLASGSEDPTPNRSFRTEKRAKSSSILLECNVRGTRRR
jgi:hypothetical protein